MSNMDGKPLRTLIVDDEPLAVERMQAVCAKIEMIDIVGTAHDGTSALATIDALKPDLVLLDMTMPEMDGLSVARKLAEDRTYRPAVIFVTAHDHFAVQAFDLDAVDYVLKPVATERLERAVTRALSRQDMADTANSPWLQELWVPHRSELLRVQMEKVRRIDAERDYVRLYVEDATYLLLQTIAGLEKRLDPDEFIRIHRSTILRRDAIRGLRHDGLGVWSVELDEKESLRIGRTYLPKVKAMAGR
ncbi:MAG: LytTR family DNA-binding domain-containing protein [Pontixanthobacter sp.]